VPLDTTGNRSRMERQTEVVRNDGARMPLTIASNIPSLKIQTQATKTSIELTNTFEKLASGLRINKASDDPAGLALAERLETDGNLMGVALRNANDGISITSVLDAALNAGSQLLSRMSELANQSANSVYTTAQRSAMQSEFVALGSEIDRVAQTTTFNGLALLSNSSSITLQIGIDGTNSSRLTIQAALGTLASLGLGSGSNLTFSLNGTTVDNAVTASRLALTAITTAQDTLNATRGSVGASESALSFVVNNLSVQRELRLEAASKIRDADVAAEVAKLVQLQVLQQAQTALLAQANQLPATALKLLG
jgi:flagellin